MKKTNAREFRLMLHFRKYLVPCRKTIRNTIEHGFPKPEKWSYIFHYFSKFDDLELHIKYWLWPTHTHIYIDRLLEPFCTFEHVTVRMDLFQHQFISRLCRCKREAHTACIWVPTAHSVEKCRKWVFQIYIIVPTHKIMSIWTLHVILGNAIWPNKLHWKTVSCTYHYANKHIQHTRTNTHTHTV